MAITASRSVIARSPGFPGLLVRRLISGPVAAFGRLGSAMPRRRGRTSNVALPAVESGGDPACALSRDSLQMQKLAAVIQASAGRGERAARFHASAAQRVDSAIYELDQLRSEIAGILESDRSRWKHPLPSRA